MCRLKEVNMIEITDEPLSPEQVIDKVRSDSSGCVVAYVGVIRDHSRGKPVLSLEYQDANGNAEDILQEIASEAKQKWQIENIAISHRLGKLKVGEISLVVAVASAHRGEGFAACQYIIDQFKEHLPTSKIEKYQTESKP
jgi:molybdopterin synthase catalytic subunit